MGRDKALLEVGGQPLITRAVDALLTSLPRAIVVTHSPDPYRNALVDRPVTFVKDHISNGGPLAGMHAGLSALDPHEFGAVTIGCDMPFVSPQAISFLAASLSGAPPTDPEEPGANSVVAFSDLEGRPQYLLSGLSRRAIPLIEHFLNTDARRSVGGFFTSLGALYIPISTVVSPNEVDRTFWNVNTPEELERARQVAYY